MYTIPAENIAKFPERTSELEDLAQKFPDQSFPILRIALSDLSDLDIHVKNVKSHSRAFHRESPTPLCHCLVS